MMDFGSKELKVLGLIVGVIILLTVLMNVEKSLFGTSYLSKAFGKESENAKAKKKMRPYVILALIVLVSIPFIYKYGCSDQCKASITGWLAGK